MPELPEPTTPAFHSGAATTTGPARTDIADASVATPAGRRTSSPLARWGFGIFAVGLLAVVVIMTLFATGSHDLPLWLNLAAMLAPAGFGIGLLGVYLEARASRAPASGPTGNQPGFATGAG